MPVTITRRTTTVILLQGDDAEELQRLRDTAAALRRRAEQLRKSAAKPVLVSDDDPVLEAEDAADAAEQEADAFAATAEERGVAVVLQALDRKRWPELLAAHPPRDDNEADKRVGANVESISEALVPEALIGPEMTEGERTDFLASLSFAQWDLLALEAWALNTTVGADPKARLGSGATRT